MKSSFKIILFLLLVCCSAGAETGELAAACPDSSRLENLEQDCLMESAAASKACSERLDPGVQNANSLGKTMAQALVGAASTTGACGRVAEYGQVLQTAVTGYTNHCTEKHQSCKSVCSQLRAAIAQSKCDSMYLQYFSANLDMVTQTCDGLKDKTQEVREQQQSQLVFVRQATNCAENTSATAKQESLTDCQINPGGPGCQAAVTPQTAIAGMQPPNLSNVTPNPLNSESPSATISARPSLAARGNSTKPLLLAAAPPSKPAVAPEVLAKQMALAARLNSGGAKPVLSDSDRPSVAAISENQSFQNSTRSPANLAQEKVTGVTKTAGLTGPDGLTGPHTDLFAKVTNRYQVLKVTLLP